MNIQENMIEKEYLEDLSRDSMSEYDNNDSDEDFFHKQPFGIK